ncbi:MAG: insulinase family protein [Clostridia bacterium]|nr:insulinase family protein [Clostridia bacterium]
MIKEKVYKNGAILIYKKRKRKCVTVTAGFVFGKNRDNYAEPIAHFCEHMLFKETENKNTEQLKDSMRETFSKYNGFTSLFYTFIDFCRSKKALVPCFELASEMLLNTKFSDENVENEKGVIKQELVRKSNIDEAKLHNACIRTIRNDYTKFTSVLGNEEEINAVTAKDLKKFRDETFISQNFVISITGGISFTKAKRFAEKHFINRLKSSPAYVPNKDILLPIQRNGNLLLEHFEKDKAMCSIAIKIDNELENQRTYQHLSYLCKISNEFSGRMISSLREKGLVYSVHIGHDTTPNMCMLEISFECSPENVNKIIDQLGIVLNEYKTIPFAEKLIENIKFKAKLAEDEQTPSPIYPDTNTFYHYLTRGKERFTKKYAKQGKKIFERTKSQDLLEFCQKVLSKPENLYVTILSNAPNETYYTYKQMQDILMR